MLLGRYFNYGQPKPSTPALGEGKANSTANQAAKPTMAASNEENDTSTEATAYKLTGTQTVIEGMGATGTNKGKIPETGLRRDTDRLQFGTVAPQDFPFSNSSKGNKGEKQKTRRPVTLTENEFITIWTQVEGGGKIQAKKLYEEKYTKDRNWRNYFEKTYKPPLYSEKEFCDLFEKYGCNSEKGTARKAHDSYLKNLKSREAIEAWFKQADGSLSEKVFCERFWERYGNKKWFDNDLRKAFSVYVRNKPFRAVVGDVVVNPPLLTWAEFYRFWEQKGKGIKELKFLDKNEGGDEAEDGRETAEEGGDMEETEEDDEDDEDEKADAFWKYLWDKKWRELVDKFYGEGQHLAPQIIPSLPELKTKAIKYIDSPATEFGFLMLADLIEEQTGLTQSQADRLSICWNTLQKWLVHLAVHIRNINEKGFQEQEARYGKYMVVEGKLNWYRDWGEEKRIVKEKANRDIKQRVENIYFSRLNDRSYGLEEITNHFIPLRAVYTHYLYLIRRKEIPTCIKEREFWAMLIWYWYYQVDALGKHFPISDRVLRFRDAYEVHINSYYESIGAIPILRNINRDYSNSTRFPYYGPTKKIKQDPLYGIYPLPDISSGIDHNPRDRFREWREWIEEGNSKGEAPAFDRLFCSFLVHRCTDLRVNMEMRNEVRTIYSIAMYLCRNEHFVDWNMVWRLRFIDAEFGPIAAPGECKAVYQVEFNQVLLEIGYIGLGELVTKMPGMSEKTSAAASGSRKSKKTEEKTAKGGNNKISDWARFLCVQPLDPGIFYSPPPRRNLDDMDGREDDITYEKRVKFIPGQWNLGSNSFCPVKSSIDFPHSVELLSMLTKPITLLEDLHTRIKDSENWARVVCSAFLTIEQKGEEQWGALPQGSRMVALEMILRAFQKLHDNRLVLAATIYNFHKQITFHFLEKLKEQKWEIDTSLIEGSLITDFFLYHLELSAGEIFPHVEPYTQLAWPEDIENEKKRSMMRNRYKAVRAEWLEFITGYRDAEDYRDSRLKICRKAGKLQRGYYEEYLQKARKAEKNRLQAEILLAQDTLDLTKKEIKKWKMEGEELQKRVEKEKDDKASGEARNLLNMKKEELMRLKGARDNAYFKLTTKRQFLKLVERGLEDLEMSKG